MAAPKAAPRSGRARGSGQAILVGLRRVPRPRGSRTAVQDSAGGARARHAAHERVPVGARAEHRCNHRPPPTSEVLRRARRRRGGRPMTTSIERLLDPNAIVVFDGAMGTMLYSKGVFINQCYDELSLRAPDMVADIHRQYVKAGADVIETNSFGANRLKLVQYGLQDQVKELNRAAAKVARDATAGTQALVAGAVGPLGVRLEPYGPTSKEEAFEIFREQMNGLLAGGVDLFILETFSDLEEIEQA